MSASVASNSAFDQILEAALGFAARGLPVFPVGIVNGKKSFLSPHGWRDASTDPFEVRRLFEAARRRVTIIGMPTGAISGFDVVDLDPRNGAHEWSGQGELPRNTLINQTPRGGAHYYFRHVDGVRKSTSVIAPGIDILGDGGCIFLWGPGYSTVNAVPFDQLQTPPDGLSQLMLAASRISPAARAGRRPSHQHYPSSDRDLR